MVKEVSVGAVVYKREKEIKYLLLHKAASETYTEQWGFPRGNLEKKETQLQTAVREIKEETGLTDLTFEEDFREKINFFYKKDGETVFKEVVFFLAELVGKQDVVISNEHSGYRWMSYETAMKTITYNNTKEVLEKADKFIKERRGQKKLVEF